MDSKQTPKRTKASKAAPSKAAAPRKRTVKKVVRNETQAATVAGPAISSDKKRRMIEEAAYYMAEQEGFTPGNEMNHWLRAEAQIEAKLNGSL